MADFKKNPRNPIEVRVPNKIRKRIAQHKKDDDVPMSAIDRITRMILILNGQKNVRLYPSWRS